MFDIRPTMFFRLSADECKQSGTSGPNADEHESHGGGACVRGGGCEESEGKLHCAGHHGERYDETPGGSAVGFRGDRFGRRMGGVFVARTVGADNEGKDVAGRST